MAKSRTDTPLNILLSLVRSALWDIPLSAEETGLISFMDRSLWNQLLEEADRQAVTGLLYIAAGKLPDSIPVPDDFTFNLMASSLRITRSFHAVQNAEDRLLAILRRGGLNPLIFKGSTLALRYPVPSLRISGDIDLYLPEPEFGTAVELIKAAGAAVRSSPDGSVQYSFDDIDVDMHRRYYDLRRKASDLPAIPSEEAELVMLSSHILKHAVGPGVGLRQICDFALACNASKKGIDNMEEVFRKAGISKWNRLLLSFVDDYLMPGSGAGTSASRPLYRIVSEGGNFGHYSSSRSRSLSRPAVRRKAGTLFSFIARIPFSMKYAPREAAAYVLELARGNFRRKPD